jgi:hypothetical protein
MLTFDDVAEMCAALPEVTVGEKHGRRTWLVGPKGFAWERPFSKADVKRFGEEPVPAGEILAVIVDDLADKEAVLAAGQKGFFTIPHFDGYAAVLIQLRIAGRKAVREALLDAWLAAAPPPLAEAHLDSRRRRRR